MSPRRGPAKCRYCKAPVEFFRSPFTGQPRKFEARPVDVLEQLAEVTA